MEFVSPFDERHRTTDPMARRPEGLDGRTVALLDITKRRSDEFLARFETLLGARGVHTFRLAKEIFSKPAAPEIIRRIANRGDLVIEGLAD